MTIDVATLVFEFKSDSAKTAEQRMDALISKGEKLEATAKRVRSATDRVNEGHRGAAGAAERAVQADMKLATAQGSVEQATRKTMDALRQEQRLRDRNAQFRAEQVIKQVADAQAASAAEVRAAQTTAKEEAAAAKLRAREVQQARAMETAAQRELVAASKAYDRDMAASTRAASAEARAARKLEAEAMRELVQAAKEYERSQADLKGRVDALRASVDPLAAAQERVNAQIREAVALHKAGAISADEYVRSVTALSQRQAGLPVLADATAKSMRGATLAGVDLSRQFADIGVQAAMMTNPLMIMVMQGPQIADRLMIMRMEGVTLAAALKSMAAAAGGLLITFGPIVAVVLAVVGALALLKQESDRVKKAMAAAETSLGRMQDEAKELAGMAGALSAATDNTATSADAAAEAFDRQANAAGVLAGKLRELNALQLGKEIRESEKRLKDMVKVGNDDGFLGMFRTSPNEARDNARDALLKSMGFGRFGDSTGQNRSPDQAISQARRNPGSLSPDARRLLNAFNVAEVELTGFNAAYKSEKEYLARLYAEANPATPQGPTLVDEIEVVAARKRARTPRMPRDVTDERTFEVAREIAQAQQEELQARLALATGAAQRAELEKRIIDAGLAEKTAEIQGRIAKIEDDKKNTKAKEQILALVGLGLKQGEIAGLQKQAVDRQRDEQIARDAHAIRMDERALQIEIAESQAATLKSTYARNVAEQGILKLKEAQERAELEEVVRRGVLGGYTEQQVAIARRRLGVLDQLYANDADQLSQQTRLLDAISEAADAVRDFKGAFKRLDFVGGLNGLMSTIQTISASFATNGMGGGLMTLGSAAGAAVGGRTGRAIGGGLGLAAGGALLGSSLVGTGGLAMSLTSGMGALGVGLGAQAGIMGMVGAIAPMLGPLALAAGALYAAAKIFNVGGKPTNAGAGVDLVTGALSGNRRTQETEQAATAAADAIKAMQEALKVAGVELPVIVQGLVLGTRDQTQIYLSNGQTLRSAVGDSGAAVDAAMKALLDNAVYASDAQRKVAEAAIAAGKGIDGLTEALAKYDAAQKLSGALADQILQLTNPQAYETKAVRDAIAEQRKAYEQLSKDGFLTAEQLATINGQLSTLEGLQLAEVMKRFTDAVDGATSDLARDRENAARAVADAQSAVVDAYNREAEVHRQAVSEYRQIASGLRNFGRELTMGAIAANDPTTQYRRAKADFDRLNALSANDPVRLAGLESAGRAFVEASRAASPSQRAFERDLNAVRQATEASQLAADQQADIAQQQLDALTSQVSLLVTLNAGVMSVAQAIQGLRDAQTVLGQLGGAANDNAFNATRYLAMNGDLAANWMAGGSTRQWGSTLEEAALYHARVFGQAEHRPGLPGFAAGGYHMGGLRLVGEEGPEIEATGPAKYYSASQTREMMSGGGDLVAEVRALKEEVASLRKERAADALLLKKYTKGTDDQLAQVIQGGNAVRTVAA